MKEFWDQRYSVDSYVYGRKPNGFFKAELDKLEPGRILLPGEGEGRNAVYAALKHWETSAFDLSSVACEKALALAKEKGVHINYSLDGYENFPFPENYYDAVGLIFSHAPGNARKTLHKNIINSLKPGGTIILEAFHTSQLGNTSGGPQSVDLLFSEEELRSDFHSLKIEKMEVASRKLDEGPFHQGEARVIRCLIKN